MIDTSTRELLVGYASRYERKEFLEGDPSWYMHQVQGAGNQEALAFLASCLSYGRRDQFLPRIGWLLERSEGETDRWIRSGDFRRDLGEGDARCFYRLYTCGTMYSLIDSYCSLMARFGTLGEYVRGRVEKGTGLEAVEAICSYFGSQGLQTVVPKDTKSACKRVCMFLRWMVRDSSPVDLGLWADFIDRRTLIIPLDTHVLQEASKLGLLEGKTASMSTARKLTARLAEVFPDDPLKGDFALFGAGVAAD